MSDDTTTLTLDELRAIRAKAAARKGKISPDEMLEMDRDPYAKGGVVRHASGNKVGAYHGKDKNFAKKAW